MSLSNIKNNLLFKGITELDRYVHCVFDKIDSIKDRLYRIYFNFFHKNPQVIPPQRNLKLTQQITSSIIQTISQDLNRNLKISIELADGSKTCFQKSEGETGEKIRDDLISYVEGLGISKELKNTIISNSHQGTFATVLSALNDQKQTIQEDLHLIGNSQDFNFMDSPLVKQEITHRINVKENNLKIHINVGFYFARKKEVFFHTKVHCDINANAKKIDSLFNEIEI